jgi:hypothetical protein
MDSDSAVRLIADAREADIGSQSADTIKLSFIRCGRLGIARCGSAPPRVPLAVQQKAAGIYAPRLTGFEN